MVVVEMPFSTVEDMNLSQGKGDANNSQEMTLIRGADSMTVLFLLLCVLYQSEILTTGEKTFESSCESARLRDFACVSVFGKFQIRIKP